MRSISVAGIPHAGKAKGIACVSLPCRPYYVCCSARCKPFADYQKAFRPLSFCERYVTLMPLRRNSPFQARARIKGTREEIVPSSVPFALTRPLSLSLSLSLSFSLSPLLRPPRARFPWLEPRQASRATAGISERNTSLPCRCPHKAVPGNLASKTWSASVPCKKSKINNGATSLGAARATGIWLEGDEGGGRERKRERERERERETLVLVAISKGDKPQRLAQRKNYSPPVSR